MPLVELTPERLAEATHLIVFCPEDAPLLTTNLARQLLAAHRPLGDVQRARKVVYFESQKGRGAA